MTLKLHEPCQQFMQPGSQIKSHWKRVVIYMYNVPLGVIRCAKVASWPLPHTFTLEGRLSGRFFSGYSFTIRVKEVDFVNEIRERDTSSPVEVRFDDLFRSMCRRLGCFGLDFFLYLECISRCRNSNTSN